MVGHLHFNDHLFPIFKLSEDIQNSTFIVYKALGELGVEDFGLSDRVWATKDGVEQRDENRFGIIICQEHFKDDKDDQSSSGTARTY